MQVERLSVDCFIITGDVESFNIPSNNKALESCQSDILKFLASVM